MIILVDFIFLGGRRTEYIFTFIYLFIYIYSVNKTNSFDPYIIKIKVFENAASKNNQETSKTHCKLHSLYTTQATNRNSIP